MTPVFGDAFVAPAAGAAAASSVALALLVALADPASSLPMAALLLVAVVVCTVRADVLSGASVEAPVAAVANRYDEVEVAVVCNILVAIEDDVVVVVVVVLGGCVVCVVVVTVVASGTNLPHLDSMVHPLPPQITAHPPSLQLKSLTCASAVLALLRMSIFATPRTTYPAGHWLEVMTSSLSARQHQTSQVESDRGGKRERESPTGDP